VLRWLYSNKLRAIPPEIGRMSQLRKLWLDSNQLTQLPEELGDCTALQVGPTEYSLLFG
jgi:Leucine-rich repeat (LRR) protein